MFANTQMMGIDLAFPDVCKTPPPPPGVPVPYPNIALGPLGAPPAAKILFMCAPAHTVSTIVPITFGDSPGVGGGIKSGTIMGMSKHTTFSATTLLLGQPATRMTSMTQQNNGNAVGCRIVPSQVKVVILAP